MARTTKVTKKKTTAKGAVKKKVVKKKTTAKKAVNKKVAVKASAAKKKAATAKKKAMAVKKKAIDAKKKAIANAAKKKLHDRIAATASALAAAKAEVAETKKRQELLLKMAKRKEEAVARFVEDWTKKEMAKIEKVMKPVKRRKRKKA